MKHATNLSPSTACTNNLCPNCQTEFVEPMTWQKLQFCPHCNIEVFGMFTSDTHTQIDKNKQKISLTQFLTHIFFKSLAFAILLSMAVVVASYYGLYDFIQDNQTALMALVILMLIIGFIISKARQKTESTETDTMSRLVYRGGIDSLEDYQSDSFEYKAIDARLKTRCESCSSYRMADLYWYKSTLAKTQVTIPQITIEETDFIGCLKCHAQFKVLAKTESNDSMKMFAIILVFAVVLFLFNHEIIKHLIDNDMLRQFIGYFSAIWFYCFLTLTPRHNKTSVNPRLKQIN